MEELKSRPDKFIFHDNFGYAKSRKIPGDTLIEHQLSEIEKLISNGTYGLQEGLSKTFFPQHGIVYYDKNNVPIASINIGLDCGKIVFWKKSFGEVKMKEKFFEKKAIEILEELKKILDTNEK
ncbi:MAG: hypothetical protein HYU67_03980 [Flavobacteriia bacterium]|nr:hypothetical protein [Flavobacteriia bacterium]